ncbi:MAG: homoserine kinase [Oscillospiraceae bacterium]|nr:homoserine kinase [Oscillospiraceae bacterium]
MYKITVPATSANIGSGFDSSGVALRLYNTVYLEASETVDIFSLDGNTAVPIGPGNLIYKAASALYERAGLGLGGLKLRQRNNIPMTRGLGSSSACIVAGLLGANALLDSRYSRAELMNIAASMEGHPDNVIPAFSGGFSTSVMSADGTVMTTRFDIEQTLQFVAFVPPFELKTSVARSVLPKTVSHGDAVYNLSRSGLLTAAFAAKDYRLLKEAVRDKLHQPHRIKMIDGADEVFELCESFGALAVYISGAGSTVMAIVSPDNRGFMTCVSKEMKASSMMSQYECILLTADNTGAVIESIDETIDDLRFIIDNSREGQDL